jgi:tRNA/rRNA methyltransferase
MNSHTAVPPAPTQTEDARSTGSPFDRLANICVVLARPRDAENVGSVCRAMKTMGITDLRIAGDHGFDRDRAAIVAVHAADVLEHSGVHDDVASAVTGCSFVVGATTRWGRRRKLSRYTPGELADHVAAAAGSHIALVFGNEATGLDDGELAACHAAVTIASSPAARSLNLSHAVQIICYEIYRRLHDDCGTRFYRPVDGERLDRAVGSIVASLAAAGVADDQPATLLRDILARAAVSRSELDRFEALFGKLAGLARRRS